jgi:fused signal recognition particle receptor
MSWLSRIKSGLSNTSSNIAKGISGIFTTRVLDDDKLEELEELLIMSDMGAAVAAEIISDLRSKKFNKEVSDSEIREFLAEYIERMLQEAVQPLVTIENTPHVILFCGVNGNGKTTTAGKIAYKLHQEGKKVMLAACDTFRAAAVEQLSVWAQRSHATLMSGELESDPASVAYAAQKRAIDEGYDVLLVDTAGRLHNKNNLMEELSKIIRVLKKANPDAPHDILLVLDATTGQNAISQLEQFSKIADISGVIITKLDGTAKAGVVVALNKKFKLPIHMIGVGEAIEDLLPFDSKAFSRNLFAL